ncbi:MAG: hypothetical protein R2788_08255 [Saprospiraceae bacterium]
MQNVQAQCTDWLNPSPTGLMDRFLILHLAAHPVMTERAAHSMKSQPTVFAAEAYAMDNIQLGGTYAISICNGPEC